MHLHSHRELTPLHRYQLEVIFLFAAGFFLFFPYYLLLERFHIDVHTWQWYFFWPWMTAYVLYVIRLRARIPESNQQLPQKRAVAHWALLGITLFVTNQGVFSGGLLSSIDLAFVIFSLFLADSYWNFRKPFQKNKNTIKQ